MVAVGLVAGPLLHQYLFHAFQPLQKDGFGFGEHHQWILISEQNGTPIEFYIKMGVQASRRMRSKISSLSSAFFRK